MLYDRDFRILTETEQAEWKAAEDVYNKVLTRRKGIVSSGDIVRYNESLPLAARYHQELFPNNFLDKQIFREPKPLKDLMIEFQSLVENTTVSERDILNFIKTRKAYFIIGSVLSGFQYNFGHHGAFLFREFELPATYKVDFLLIGDSSEGHSFVFVELESPYGQITTSDGEFGAVIRKGIKQVTEWDIWLEKNYSALKLIYDKELGLTQPLPNEFVELDKSRIHYVVIAGRRTDFNDKTYKLRRRLRKSDSVLVLHYDNLFDSVEHLIERKNY